MINKDIDLTKIEKLLKSLPEDIEVNTINLREGYQVEFTKTYEEYTADRKAEALNYLMEFIEDYKKSEFLRNSEEEQSP